MKTKAVNEPTIYTAQITIFQVISKRYMIKLCLCGLLQRHGFHAPNRSVPLKTQNPSEHVNRGATRAVMRTRLIDLVGTP